mmetsp:Transcript_24600/g.36666  ORF Transcript_24600/g.36666 Transcript_24600/m.36666 type:complete len:167 (+) Transcript_24600:764-1264(+)
MREILSSKDFEQIPQLTSSRYIDVNETMQIVKGHGAKRALLIGINYVGQNGELSGCHNDVLNIKEYLMDVLGFEEDNIMVLMDDGIHHEPTRDSILSGYRRLVAESVAGDTVFCHYSGKYFSQYLVVIYVQVIQQCARFVDSIFVDRIVFEYFFDCFHIQVMVVGW